MSKKDAILNKAVETKEYDLTSEEIVEIASLVALIQQAEAARNYIYSRIAQNVADRLEIKDKEISFNFEEIMNQGAKFAKLIVKD
jgi:hypothetical protein